jgi:Arginase family
MASHTSASDSVEASARPLICSNRRIRYSSVVGWMCSARPARSARHRHPEAGGLTSRDLLGILRGLAGPHLAAADVAEVAPACDHAEMTTVAAARVCYELLALMLLGR